MCTMALNGSSKDPRKCDIDVYIIKSNTCAMNQILALFQCIPVFWKASYYGLKGNKMIAEGVTVIGILSFYGVICGLCIIYITYIIITSIKNRRNGRSTWGCCYNVDRHSKLKESQDIVMKESGHSSPIMKPPDEAFV